MKDSGRYVKIVEWSYDDQCYVGSAPGLIYGGCHGPDEKQVFDELCEIVDEAINVVSKRWQASSSAYCGPRLRTTSSREFS